MKKFLTVLSGLIFICFVAFGQSSPELIRDEAFRNIKKANDLVNQAHATLKYNQTIDTIKRSVAMFIEAGQLFEQSANLLRGLGPEYVSAQDLAGCEQAVETCLKSIYDCQERLRSLSAK
ncbi:MAG: hypothetical protein PHV17_02175 [Candidatus Omnitrophica bacterium]|nr:hypothetical protein [Candidatus Omnitrophota bacterium]